jgi:hypothetical protein
MGFVGDRFPCCHPIAIVVDGHYLVLFRLRVAVVDQDLAIVIVPNDESVAPIF